MKGGHGGQKIVALSGFLFCGKGIYQIENIHSTAHSKRKGPPDQQSIEERIPSINVIPNVRNPENGMSQTGDPRKKKNQKRGNHKQEENVGNATKSTPRKLIPICKVHGS